MTPDLSKNGDSVVVLIKTSDLVGRDVGVGEKCTNVCKLGFTQTSSNM